jgi:hypothetical protein
MMMMIEITFLDSEPVERRFKNSTLWDVIDYPFRVSDGKSSRTVKVGITGQFHDPAEALGLKKLSRAEMVDAASSWLRSRLDKGECDPFHPP